MEKATKGLNIDTNLRIIQRPDTINLGRSTAKLSNKFGGGHCADGTSESQNERGGRSKHRFDR